MKTLLVTGFAPFGGRAENPSMQAVRLLPERVCGYTLAKAEVPVVFGKAGRRVIALAERLRPDAILCVGLAAGRDRLTPEYAALNVRYAAAPDNEGGAPAPEPVAPGGPEAYFSTLPAAEEAAAAAAAGIPAAVSFHAGTFVCNDLFYTLLHRYAGTDVRVGFVHVPLTPELAAPGEPCLPLAETVRGLEAMIGAL